MHHIPIKLNICEPIDILSMDKHSWYPTTRHIHSTVYRRGFKGLSRQIDLIHQQTGGNLGYVGEWHSHPAEVPAIPSTLDQKAHDWLVEEMGHTGHPRLMLIKSDDHLPHVLLREQ